MSFTGFDPGAVAVLASLPAMSAADYDQHKHDLKRGVVEPGLELIRDVAGRLGLTVSPRSSASPLHRDLRFAPTGTPRYKDHLLLTAWQGADKKSSPTIWIRIDANKVGFASGIAFTPAIRERWRSEVGARRGSALADAIDALVSERSAEVAGEQLKRVPAPFAADHPRADLLRRTGFQIRFVEPLPDGIAAPSFVDWCVERARRLMPVHGWLAANLTDGTGGS